MLVDWPRSHQITIIRGLITNLFAMDTLATQTRPCVDGSAHLMGVRASPLVLMDWRAVRHTPHAGSPPHPESVSRLVLMGVDR